MRIKYSSRSVGFRVLSATLIFSSALLLSSCSSAADEPTGPEVEQAVGLAVDAPRVVVTDQGSGEKRQLSYHDLGAEGADSSAQNVTIKIADGFAQSVGTADQVNPTAPAGGDVTTLSLPVSAITSQPEASAEEAIPASREIEMKVGNPTISDPAQTADVISAEGFTLGMRATDTGQHSTVSFAAPVDATENGRVMMEQSLLTFTSLPVVFPEEEIGAGASWTVDSRVTGDANLLQTVTYTVNSINQDTVDLEVSISQRPSVGAIDITEDAATGDQDPQSTPEQLSVLNSNTTSVGQLTVDLTKPLPTSGQVSWTTRVIYGGASNDTRVVQDSTKSIAFES